VPARLDCCLAGFRRAACGGAACGSAAAVRKVLNELTSEESGQRVATVDDGVVVAGRLAAGLFETGYLKRGRRRQAATCAVRHGGRFLLDALCAEVSSAWALATDFATNGRGGGAAAFGRRRLRCISWMSPCRRGACALSFSSRRYQHWRLVPRSSR